jgi:hypothetical protein
MKLKNYTPAGNQVVVHLIKHNKVGLLYIPTSYSDKVLKVVAVGPLCEKTKVNDYVLLDDRQFLQMELTVDEGTITVLLAREFDIIGYYIPDAEELSSAIATSKAFAGTETQDSDSVRELNIIDGPGMEHSTYLKEEAENNKI